MQYFIAEHHTESQEGINFSIWRPPLNLSLISQWFFI